MLDTIQKKLDEIERQENVKILHCVESGSRAWGFASPDSDYDVRFVYLRKREDYLRLEGIRDVIEWQLDDVLDINGWDIQKYLRLLYKSNPTVFEWDRSPIVYRTTPEWEQISAVTGQYFRQDHLLHHYLSMAKSNEHAYLREKQVRLKKYFYVIRPLLACRWVLDQGTPPPIEFAKLMQAELP
ncbi:MAG: nucleotidyltransferase domain-containing protein, partial [Oscillospiraceae bacterium]|nr:nucleotidyltransferase domain-containing protein [Oscillospiraceae bacterium]